MVAASGGQGDRRNARQYDERGRDLQEVATRGSTAPVQNREQHPADDGTEERHLREAAERDHLAVHPRNGTPAAWIAAAAAVVTAAAAWHRRRWCRRRGTGGEAR